jgi:hypothetical protein
MNRCRNDIEILPTPSLSNIVDLITLILPPAMPHDRRR